MKYHYGEGLIGLKFLLQCSLKKKGDKTGMLGIRLLVRINAYVPGSEYEVPFEK
jgi:hypothetical protein